MDIEERIKAFLLLANAVETLPDNKRDALYTRAMASNPWFTSDHIDLAFSGMQRYLEEDALRTWLQRYDPSPGNPRTVGVVMAGNIPLVGLHDFLCVLLSGHRIMIKLSALDDVLLPFIADLLIGAEPRFADRIVFSERLHSFDAVVATGSDNSARYFRYYFSHVPHIIRQNRTALALINGNETSASLEGLARDIHEYFGLGCRNVSKILLPHGYDPSNLVPALRRYSHFVQHNKYANNYEYQKAILTMNRCSFVDTGAGLLRENDGLVSPIAVTYYGFYRSTGERDAYLEANSNKLQCIVAEPGQVERSISPGNAQRPGISDYADGVDTMQFLCEL